MKLYTNNNEKRGANNQLMEKEKNQTICTTTFKEKTRRKLIDFVINPRGVPMSLYAYMGGDSGLGIDHCGTPNVGTRESTIYHVYY